MKFVEAFAIGGVLLWMSAWFFGIGPDYSRMTFLLVIACYARIVQMHPTTPTKG